MAASTENNQAYEEAMDDVHTRFILNLPDEELQSAPRIFFQIEQAWWFYDDFICDGQAEAIKAAAAAAAAVAAEGGDNEEKASEEELLPRFKHVKPFALAMFKFSPLLQPMLPEFDAMFGEFSKYKRSISTYGTILLNKDCTKVALCRVYQGKSWTLPGGKVNQNESGKDAAARETYEETGFDPQNERGLCGKLQELRERGGVVPKLAAEEAPSDEEDDDGLFVLPWEPLQDGDKLVYTENDTKKRRTCYVCRGVPLDFPFEPVARKEISEVSWHDLSSLPKHTYAVLPFMAQLKKWIRRNNKKRGVGMREKSRSGSRSKSRQKGKEFITPTSIKKRGGNSRSKQRKEKEPLDKNLDDGLKDIGLTPFFTDEGNAPWEELKPPAVEDDAKSKESKQDTAGASKKKKEKKRDKSNGKKQHRKPSSRAGSRGREVAADDPLVESALVSPGERNRWTEDEMFATNEQILGRKITYDGNPHDFAEKGFDVGGEGRVDPHAFRVLGGTFMNSDQGGTSAPPDAKALQPLMSARKRSNSKGSNVSGLSGDDTNNGDNVGDELGLTPFFSDDGKAPWEDGGGSLGGLGLDAVKKHITPPPVRSAQQPSGQSNSKGLALLNRLRQGTSANEEVAVIEEEQQAPAASFGKREKGNAIKDKKKKWKKNEKKEAGVLAEDSTDWFMTDKQITAKSQKEKLSILPPPTSYPSMTASVVPIELTAPTATPPVANDGHHTNNDEHLEWMKRWAQQLPQAGPTKAFGDFRLDADAVMNAMMPITH